MPRWKSRHCTRSIQYSTVTFGPKRSQLKIRTSGSCSLLRAESGLLLSCFDLRRNQTDFIDPRSMRDIDHLGYVGERNLVIAFDKHHPFRPRFEYVGQALSQMIPGLVILVDFELRTLPGRRLDHLDDNRPIIRFLLFLLVLRRLRNQSVEAARGKRSNHHKDDEQHKEHVDEWGDVDICCGTSTVVPDCHCHMKSPRESAARRRILKFIRRPPVRSHRELACAPPEAGAARSKDQAGPRRPIEHCRLQPLRCRTWPAHRL